MDHGTNKRHYQPLTKHMDCEECLGRSRLVLRDQFVFSSVRECDSLDHDVCQVVPGGDSDVGALLEWGIILEPSDRWRWLTVHIHLHLQDSSDVNGYVLVTLVKVEVWRRCKIG